MACIEAIFQPSQLGQHLWKHKPADVLQYRQESFSPLSWGNTSGNLSRAVGVGDFVDLSALSVGATPLETLSRRASHSSSTNFQPSQLGQHLWKPCAWRHHAASLALSALSVGATPLETARAVTEFYLSFDIFSQQGPFLPLSALHL